MKRESWEGINPAPDFISKPGVAQKIRWNEHQTVNAWTVIWCCIGEARKDVRPVALSIIGRLEAFRRKSYKSAVKLRRDDAELDEIILVKIQQIH